MLSSGNTPPENGAPPPRHSRSRACQRVRPGSARPALAAARHRVPRALEAVARRTAQISWAPPVDVRPYAHTALPRGKAEAILPVPRYHETAELAAGVEAPKFDKVLRLQQRETLRTPKCARTTISHRADDHFWP